MTVLRDGAARPAERGQVGPAPGTRYLLSSRRGRVLATAGVVWTAPEPGRPGELVPLRGFAFSNTTAVSSSPRHRRTTLLSSGCHARPGSPGELSTFPPRLRLPAFPGAPLPGALFFGVALSFLSSRPIRTRPRATSTRRRSSGPSTVSGGRLVLGIAVAVVRLVRSRAAPRPPHGLVRFLLAGTAGGLLGRLRPPAAPPQGASPSHSQASPSSRSSSSPLRSIARSLTSDPLVSTTLPHSRSSDLVLPDPFHPGFRLLTFPFHSLFAGLPSRSAHSSSRLGPPF